MVQHFYSFQTIFEESVYLTSLLVFAGLDFQEIMNWLQRKIYLYNVTFGLYMLDWWERCLFSILDSYKTMLEF